MMGPADDTTLVVRAVAAQLRKDYRRANLYFARTLLCGDEHPQPCERTSVLPDTVPRVIAVMTAAAGGALQCARPSQSCSDGPDTFEFAIKAPQVFSDTALVSITAFSQFVESDSTVVVAFERYIYRASKMSSLAWRVTARYLDATGAYDYRKRPPRSEKRLSFDAPRR